MKEFIPQKAEKEVISIRIESNLLDEIDANMRWRIEGPENSSRRTRRKGRNKSPPMIIVSSAAGKFLKKKKQPEVPAVFFQGAVQGMTAWPGETAVSSSRGPPMEGGGVSNT